MVKLVLPVCHAVRSTTCHPSEWPSPTLLPLISALLNPPADRPSPSVNFRRATWACAWRISGKRQRPLTSSLHNAAATCRVAMK